MLCVNSMALEPDGEGTVLEARGREEKRVIATAPDLEVPLAGERLMAASNR